MKKLVITGTLAAALIVGGGTGAYLAYAKDHTTNDGIYYMQQNGMNVQQMSNSVKSGNFEDMQQFMQGQNIDFGQMKSYMKQMHPNVSDQQLEDMYKSMHGTGGSAKNQTYQGTMKNF